MHQIQKFITALSRTTTTTSNNMADINLLQRTTGNYFIKLLAEKKILDENRRYVTLKSLTAVR